MNKTNLKFAILATDVLLFTVIEKKLYVRLISVDRPPHFVGVSGLPGGLVGPQETALEAAKRHLRDKSYISSSKVYLEQLYTFSGIDRDPRGRVVSVAYFGCVSWDSLNAEEKGNYSETYWQEISTIGKLAYDHKEIITVGLERLKTKIKYTTLISKLLPAEFTISDLQSVYEMILGIKIDKRNFIKRINQLAIIISVDKKRQGQKARPAQLYKFKNRKVIEALIIH